MQLFNFTTALMLNATSKLLSLSTSEYVNIKSRLAPLGFFQGQMDYYSQMMEVPGIFDWVKQKECDYDCEYVQEWDSDRQSFVYKPTCSKQFTLPPSTPSRIDAIYDPVMCDIHTGDYQVCEKPAKEREYFISHDTAREKVAGLINNMPVTWLYLMVSSNKLDIDGVTDMDSLRNLINNIENPNDFTAFSYHDYKNVLNSTLDFMYKSVCDPSCAVTSTPNCPYWVEDKCTKQVGNTMYIVPYDEEICRIAKVYMNCYTVPNNAPQSSENYTGLIVGIVCAVVAIGIGIAVVLYIKRKKSAEQEAEP